MLDGKQVKIICNLFGLHIYILLIDTWCCIFGRFIKQYALLVLVGQMASALFRMDAAICRNMIVANTLGSFIVIILLTLGGFILSRGTSYILYKISVEISFFSKFHCTLV